MEANKKFYCRKFYGTENKFMSNCESQCEICKEQVKSQQEYTQNLIKTLKNPAL